MKKYEGYFQNGDHWDGYKYEEDGKWWFRAIDAITGMEYDTEEIPDTYPLFTMEQFVGTWTRQQVEDYRNINSLIR